MKLFEKVKINKGKSKEREIRVLGFPICKYGKICNNDTKEKYCEIFPKKDEYRILDDIIAQTKNRKEQIFLLNRHGMGETYILANIIQQINLFQPLNNLLVISRREYVKDVFAMFCPSVQVQIVTTKEWHNIFSKSYYSYKGKKIHIFLLPKYFDNMYNNFFKGKENHYFTSLLSHYSLIQENIKFNIPIISLNHEKKLLDKINSTLNIKKFVIICPEALSAVSYSIDFWKDIIKSLKTKGYDIYINSKNTDIYGENSLFLTVTELFILAKYASAIIGLRCGLLEVLSCHTTHTPFHILYTPHPFRKGLTAQKYIETHTIKKLPNVCTKNVVEYDTEKQSSKIIMKQILKRL